MITEKDTEGRIVNITIPVLEGLLVWDTQSGACCISSSESDSKRSSCLESSLSGGMWCHPVGG